MLSFLPKTKQLRIVYEVHISNRNKRCLLFSWQLLNMVDITVDSRMLLMTSTLNRIRVTENIPLSQ